MGHQCGPNVMEIHPIVRYLGNFTLNQSQWDLSAGELECLYKISIWTKVMGRHCHL